MSLLAYAFMVLLAAITLTSVLVARRCLQYADELAEFHSKFTDKVDDMLFDLEKYLKNPVHQFEEDKIALQHSILAFRNTLELAQRSVLAEDETEDDEDLA